MSIVETGQACWLKCRLSKGMFSDEIAVTYPADGPVKKSVFVPRTEVSGEIDSVGKVRVDIVRRQNVTMALLPSAHRDMVVVSDQDVSLK